MDILRDYRILSGLWLQKLYKSFAHKKKAQRKEHSYPSCKLTQGWNTHWMNEDNAFAYKVNGDQMSSLVQLYVMEH